MDYNKTTVGSRIDFSGSVFGSSNQFDYINFSSTTPNPNELGSFQVNDATKTFAPILANTSQLGLIRDIHEGISSGLITQSAPLFDGSDNPSLYVSDFLSLTIPNSVNFSFDVKTIDRTVRTDPNSPDPSNPTILDVSSIITGSITDFTTGEVQEAIVVFNPDIPSGVLVNQLTPDNFLGPISYNASLQVVDDTYAVSDSYIVDFETTSSGDQLVAGTEITNQYDSLSGLTISTPRDECGAIVFDSSIFSGFDQTTEELGNVLILSNDSDVFGPDAQSTNNTIRFQWSEDVLVKSVELLGIDNTGGFINAYSDHGDLLRTVDIPNFGNNSLGQIDIDTAEVAYLDINLIGNSAITELSFNSLSEV